MVILLHFNNVISNCLLGFNNTCNILISPYSTFILFYQVPLALAVTSNFKIKKGDTLDSIHVQCNPFSFINFLFSRIFVKRIKCTIVLNEGVKFEIVVLSLNRIN